MFPGLVRSCATALLVALLGTPLIVGCADSGPPPDAPKVVQGQSIEESTGKSSSKKKKKAPAPVQRLKNGLE